MFWNDGIRVSLLPDSGNGRGVDRELHDTARIKRKAAFSKPVMATMVVWALVSASVEVNGILSTVVCHKRKKHRKKKQRNMRSSCLLLWCAFTASSLTASRIFQGGCSSTRRTQSPAKRRRRLPLCVHSSKIGSKPSFSNLPQTLRKSGIKSKCDEHTMLLC